AHEGSLVGGHQRTIDVAGIGEEPAAVDGTDTVAEVGVDLLVRHLRKGNRSELRGSFFEILGGPEEDGIRSMAGCNGATKRAALDCGGRRDGATRHDASRALE